MKKNYTPISCVFYDLIEHYATRKEIVSIEVQKESERATYNSRILDTQVENKVEYIVLESPAIRIRMDQIISLNEEKLWDYKKC